MLDIGWSELLVIGVVALIVVGPKDLPRMFAALGRFTGKARSMAREFQRAMDDAAKESGVKEAASDLKALTGKKALGIDKLEEAARKFEKWDPVKDGRSAAASAPPGSETARLAEERAAKAESVRAAATASAARAVGGTPPEPEQPAQPADGTQSKAGDA